MADIAPTRGERGAWMRVVYIAGWMRSGTTLLGEMLGAQPRVLCAGEVLGIWSAAARGGFCSCRVPLPECPVWGEALRAATHAVALGPGDYGKLGALTARHFRTRNTLKLLRTGECDDPELGRVLHATVELLRSALSLVGAEVLVDTSKLLPGMLLHRLTGQPLHVVHILRDPRAVVASERRTAHLASGNDSFAPPGASPVVSLLRWYGANLSVAVGSRALRLSRTEVTYDGLVRQPIATMRWLAERTDLEFDAASVNDASVSVGSGHIAVGNPQRLMRGRRELAVDDRWRTELVGRDRLVAETGAAPALALMRACGR